MKKFIAVFSCYLLSFLFCVGQDLKKVDTVVISKGGRNALYGEVGITKSYYDMYWYTINYERVFFSRNNFNLSFKTGLGNVPFDLRIPTEIMFFYGNKYTLETGCGFMTKLGNYKNDRVDNREMTINVSKVFFLWHGVAFRFQESPKGFLFKFGYIPLSTIVMKYNNEFLFYFTKEDFKRIGFHFGLSLSMGWKF